MSVSEPDAQDAPELQAAELALGLLDGVERTSAERRSVDDPAFARHVEAWQNRLAALMDNLRPQAPPAALWDRIAVAIGGDSQVVVLKLRRSVAVWRGATGIAAAIAAVLTAALVWPRPAAPLMTARLSGTHGPAVFVAMFDPSQGRIVLTPATVAATPDRAPELWLIPDGGKPIALGVAAFERAIQLSPRVAPNGAGAVLAVSIEPRGGSPTGQPTGPVVATGKLEALQTS